MCAGFCNFLPMHARVKKVLSEGVPLWRCFFLLVFFSDEGREDPITIKSGPLLDWVQSLKQFFTNVPYHILVAILTLLALFKIEPSECSLATSIWKVHWWKIAFLGLEPVFRQSHQSKNSYKYMIWHIDENCFKNWSQSRPLSLPANETPRKWHISGGPMIAILVAMWFFMQRSNSGMLFELLNSISVWMSRTLL